MRTRCIRCLQPEFSCFCGWSRPFDPEMDFVILTHPIEVKRRRIATGRLAHLNLKSSHWLMGHRFTDDPALLKLIKDPQRECVMLYPGVNSANLSEMSFEARVGLAHPSKRLTVIVIDGTWATARSTVNQSPLLSGLRRVCFTPPGVSNFRIRRQPRPECYSTIEAIHHTIELLGPSRGLCLEARAHDHLLEVFERMVNRQIELAYAYD